MTPPAGLIEFFIGEATDYLDRLRSLLAAAMLGGQPGVPDGEAFASSAHALRGAATMARLDALAELALALERAGRETIASRLKWDVPMHAAVAAALDDIRELLPATRHWDARHDSRVRARTADLVGHLPIDATRPTPGAGSSTLSSSYLAAELESIGASLAPRAPTPDHASTLSAVAPHARALRGIAGLDEVPLVGDLLDAVERTTGDTASPATRESEAMLIAAGRLLIRIAGDLRAGRRPDESSDEARAFASALTALRDGAESRTRAATPVVPIESLFYADAGPHVVERAPDATAVRDARLRRELLPHAEHLRRLLADADSSTDAIARTRIADDLRRAVRAVAAIASSFGARDAADALDRLARDEEPLAPLARAMLDEVAARIAEPDASADTIGRSLLDLDRDRGLARGLARGFAPIVVEPSVANEIAETTSAPALPIEVPSERADISHTTSPRAGTSRPGTPRRIRAVSPRTPTPTGRDLHDLLSHGIAGFQDLEREPLSQPAPLEDVEVVPIEVLLYRGRAALERALEVRDQIRSRGEPGDDALGELFDLLDLATAE